MIMAFITFVVGIVFGFILGLLVGVRNSDDYNSLSRINRNCMCFGNPENRNDVIMGATFNPNKQDIISGMDK